MSIGFRRCMFNNGFTWRLILENETKRLYWRGAKESTLVDLWIQTSVIDLDDAHLVIWTRWYTSMNGSNYALQVWKRRRYGARAVASSQRQVSTLYNWVTCRHILITLISASAFSEMLFSLSKAHCIVNTSHWDLKICPQERWRYFIANPIWTRIQYVNC